MTMLQTSTVLFAIAALGGLTMAAIRFSKVVNPPAWLAMLHGLLAASGLTLLVYAACTTPVPRLAIVALVLFLVVAAVGAVMSLQYKWKQRLLPSGLVIGHALAAVTAFLLLAVSAFAG